MTACFHIFSKLLIINYLNILCCVVVATSKDTHELPHQWLPKLLLCIYFSTSECILITFIWGHVKHLLGYEGFLYLFSFKYIIHGHKQNI